MPNYGEFNTALTAAIRGVVYADDPGIGWRDHAYEQMDDRGFDKDDVMTCLKRGKAYGPELRDGEIRANVVHAGLSIRVAVACLYVQWDDWSSLKTIDVVTVMETK